MGSGAMCAENFEPFTLLHTCEIHPRVPRGVLVVSLVDKIHQTHGIQYSTVPLVRVGGHGHPLRCHGGLVTPRSFETKYTKGTNPQASKNTWRRTTRSTDAYAQQGGARIFC